MVDVDIANIKHANTKQDNDELYLLANFIVRLDLDLAYTSEKLGNLELHITNLSLSRNDIGALSREDGDISAEETERHLIFDLSLAYLDSEVSELEFLSKSLQAQIILRQEKLSSSENTGESSVSSLLTKLHTSRTFLKQLLEQVAEIKKQLGKLYEIISTTGPGNSYMFTDEHCEDLKLNQQKVVLRMLEKSIGQELDLEKKLSESKQNEEELKSKLCITEQVVCSLEAACTVAWERLLEADNAAEVFKGVAKEMLCRLQIVQFSLNGSLLREEELKFKLQEANANQHSEQRSEMNDLKEKTARAEEKLKESEARVRRASTMNEANREQLSKAGHKIEILRRSLFVAESRADEAEAKLAALAETNVELTEELGFLKGSSDSKNEKISLLEKQVRELGNQLQHAKATSEASQEQQNMLYLAIWDMETLIEDVKSRVSKAETRAKNEQDQRLVLAHKVLELNKEISQLKSSIGSLEGSLIEADRLKKARAKEINTGTKLVTDMVMQLASERERIQKQLHSLVRQNKILKQEMRGSNKKVSETKPCTKEAGERDLVSFVENSASTISQEAANDDLTEPISTSHHVDEPSALENETNAGSSAVYEDTSATVLKSEATGPKGDLQLGGKYIVMAVLSLLIALALCMYQEKTFSFFRRRLGLF